MSDNSKHGFLRATENENFDGLDGVVEPTHASSSNQTEPRRRASRAGTRSVATLTDAQLARKRANDREAQRSIRQRTKDRIERLEQRIQELTDGQNDDRSFEEVSRRNEELEEELRQLREGMPHQEGLMMISNLPQRPKHPGLSMPPHTMSYQSPRHLPNMSPGATGMLTSHPTPTFNSAFSSQNSAYSPSAAGSPLSEMGSASDYFGSVDVNPPSFVNRPMPQVPPQRPSMLGGRPVIVRSVSQPDTRPQEQAWPPRPFALMGIDENMSVSGSSLMANRQEMHERRKSSIPPSKPAIPSMTSMLAQYSNLSTRPGSLSSEFAVATSNYSTPSDITSIPANNSIAGIPQLMHHVSGSLSSVGMTASASANMPINQISPVSVPAQMGLDQMSSSNVTTSQPSTSFQDSQSSLSIWELTLRFVPPTGPFDEILVGILQRQRSLAVGGTTGEALIGPLQPSLSALLYPERTNVTHPVASVIASLLQRTALRQLSEKAAALFIIYRQMQWQILPTPETYSKIPEWFKPITSQIMTPHPIWASQIIWPKLREVVIKNQDLYATDEFLHIYTASLNINWPYRDADVISYEGNDMKMSEAFEQHVCNFANWSLDKPFATRYPDLRNTCAITSVH